MGKKGGGSKGSHQDRHPGWRLEGGPSVQLHQRLLMVHSEVPPEQQQGVDRHHGGLPAEHLGGLGDVRVDQPGALVPPDVEVDGSGVHEDPSCAHGGLGSIMSCCLVTLGVSWTHVRYGQWRRLVNKLAPNLEMLTALERSLQQGAKFPEASGRSTQVEGASVS